MNCPKCNFEVDTTTTFCTNCGAPIDTVQETDTDTNGAIHEEIAPYYEKPISQSRPHLSKKLPQLIGVIVSIVVIIIGVVTASGGKGYITASSGEVTETEHEYYGGDAYTGIQQASADASNNAGVAAKNVEITNDILNDISEDVVFAIGMLIISIGLLGGAYFANDLMKKEY